VIELTRFRLRKHIPLDSWPSEVIAHPKELRAYVLCPENGTVYEIDAIKLQVSRRARAGDRATSMQLSPAGDAVWVLVPSPGALVEIPFKTMQPGRRISLPLAGHAFDLNGTRAAIASARHRAIMVASLETGAVERQIPAADEPSMIAF